MKALQWHAARDLRLSQVQLRQPGPGEVLLQVAYCGICGSDLHEYADGPHSIPQHKVHPLSGCRAPLTLGHEFCGQVTALGPDVDPGLLGQRVAVERSTAAANASTAAGASTTCVNPWALSA